ncbi:release factor glutamine methyltransferase [Kribbella amoyensis]|uniref:peptide chain release factor N(5)-glutamine methyltransferase n=1 Tax=Kribbella amoyensis TaxID=996641 RepID=A0A561BZ69_9ACTN|nr:putative protein N(5)-glutamine methyltransferase [Kribbella amoyensis]TWD84216.1 release factor glutamine methyltransferase [Kribbella amoyensis]
MVTVPPVEIVNALRSAGCVFAEEEAELILQTAPDDATVAVMVEQRAAGHPLEQVLGWASFHGLRIAVDPGVFVPRRRTEYLVDEAIALARRRLAVGTPALRVVDLCCGTGALGAAVASAIDGVELYAADIEPAAVRNARRNLEPLGAQAFEGDLFDALPIDLRGRIDLLLCNVPYVPTSELHLLPAEAREYEPKVTLDGGSDGLDVFRRVVPVALDWLTAGAHLLVETSDRQAAIAVSILESHGYWTTVATSEDLGATVVIGTTTN